MVTELSSSVQSEHGVASCSFTSFMFRFCLGGIGGRTSVSERLRLDLHLEDFLTLGGLTVEEESTTGSVFSFTGVEESIEKEQFILGGTGGMTALASDMDRLL